MCPFANEEATLTAVGDLYENPLQMSSGGAKVSLAGTFVRCHSFPADPGRAGARCLVHRAFELRH